jgi:hypothetical protein
MKDCLGEENLCIEPVECPICLEAIDKVDISAITVKCCNNKFHSVCHGRCVAIKNECPLCRACECVQTQSDDMCIPGVSTGSDVPHVVGILHNFDMPYRIINIHHSVRCNNIRRVVRRRLYLFCVVSGFVYGCLWFFEEPM